MTDKLICPFCSTKLDMAELAYITNCGCPKCHIVGDIRLWKRIFTLGKKLDMAVIHLCDKHIKEIEDIKEK